MFGEIKKSVVQYQVHYCHHWRREAQECVWDLTVQIQDRGLRCMTDRLRCLAGRANRTAHLSRGPDPSLAHRNSFLPSARKEKVHQDKSYIWRQQSCSVLSRWRTCLSSCSRFVMDRGASKGFCSFSVSSVVCVFVTAPARGSRNTYFLYLNAEHTRKHASTDWQQAEASVCVFVFKTHRFSVVLKSSRELTDEMFRGRLPSPSSASSSDFFLLLTHNGKCINFS